MRLRSFVLAASVALSGVSLAPVARADQAAPVAVRAPTTIPVALTKQRARLYAALRPELRAKLAPVVRDFMARATQPVPKGAVAPAPLDVAKRALADGANLGLGDLSGGDIEALAFIVMMEAAHEADADLKAIMGKVKAIDAAKGCRRAKAPKQCIASLQVSAEMPKSALDAVIDQMKGDLDSLSEMGEMESLRLQMAMDRLSKLMSTLSNLLKKISDTSSSIVQNLK